MSSKAEKSKTIIHQVKTALDKAAKLAAGAQKAAASQPAAKKETVSGGKAATTEYKTYTGGDQELDEALKGYSDQYAQARARALTGDERAVTEMREANDRANQLRNQKGYAAQLADKDLAYVKGVAERAQAGKTDPAGRTGKTTVTVRESKSSAPKAAALPEVKDYSGYLEEMARAKKEAAVAQLQAAYEKSLAQLDRAQETVSPTYQAARNRAAGETEAAKRQFNEYAVAHGLGSGAGGQAQLAMGSQLQGTLGELDAKEADALAALELQRTQTKLDYDAAIAQAQAEGDYELAGKLYQEKIRQDEAMADQIKWQAQQDYQQAYFGWQQEEADRTAASRDEAAQREREEALGELLLQYAAETGDYSGLGRLYTPEQIGRLEESWRAKRDAQAQQAERDAQEVRREEADWAAKYGDYSGLKALGVDTSALEREQAEQAAKAAAGKSAGSSGKKAAAGSGSYKPRLTVSQVDKAIANGIVTDQVKRDFSYFYGAEYDKVFPREGQGDKAAATGTLTEARFESALSTIATFLSRGETDLARQGAEALEGRMSPRQKARLEELWGELAG